MTLKSSESEGGGGMRTALSDLYLEHLLQKRSRPEVSSAARPQGEGLRHVLSFAMRRGAPHARSRPREV